MGELKDVLAPALSSTNRAKSHWRGKTLKSKTPAVDAFACNEVRLLVSCLAYQAMHIARRAMAKATQGCSVLSFISQSADVADATEGVGVAVLAD